MYTLSLWRRQTPRSALPARPTARHQPRGRAQISSAPPAACHVRRLRVRQLTLRVSQLANKTNVWKQDS